MNSFLIVLSCLFLCISFLESFLQLPAKQMDDSNTSQLLASANTSQLNTSQQDYEAEEEVGLELPPPMKPILEPHLMANGPPTFNKDMMKDNSSVMVSYVKLYKEI